MLSREDLVGSAPAATDPDDAEMSNLDIAYHALRSAILSLRFPPGAILSQVKVAEELGVSRTPLREAIRLLQRDGLITTEHNKRVRIADTSIEDMEQLYAARIALEAVAIRISVPRLSSDHLGELAALLDVMDNFRTPRTLDAWEKSHRRFHALLTGPAGGRIARELSEMSDHAERYRRAYIAIGSGGWEQSAGEHRAIFTACKARDGREASVLLARHLARTSLSIFLSKAPDHEPVMIRTALKVVQRQD